jgi:hypothetical protein
MDPDEALRELLRLADVELNSEQPAGDPYRMAELVQALDGWLTSGGFLPARWSSERR